MFIAICSNVRRLMEACLRELPLWLCGSGTGKDISNVPFVQFDSRLFPPPFSLLLGRTGDTALGAPRGVSAKFPPHVLQGLITAFLGGWLVTSLGLPLCPLTKVEQIILLP